MNKKYFLITLTSIFLLAILVGSVSAGLCKGDDGYYHECNSKSYSKSKCYDDYYSKSRKYCDEYDSEDVEEKIEQHYDAGVELGYYKSFYDNYKDFEEKNWEYYDVGYYSGNEAGKYKGLYEGYKEGLGQGYSWGEDAGEYKGRYEEIKNQQTRSFSGSGGNTFSGGLYSTRIVKPYYPYERATGSDTCDSPSCWRFKGPYSPTLYRMGEYYNAKYDGSLGYFNWRY